MGIASLMYHKRKIGNVAPINGVVYGVKIDTTNTDSASALTYIDDATDLTPARVNNKIFSYGDWADKFPFNQVKPCVLKLGVVQYYLNPDNYAQKEDGTPSVITGADGDVMIEIPKIYWKFEKVGTDLFVRYSNVKIDADYQCLAHTKGTVEKDKLYIGAYLGSGVWRSVSGSLPSTGSSANLDSLRNYFKVNSQYTGYSSITHFQHLMLQILCTILFKDRDSKLALGLGQQSTSLTNEYKSTGLENASGMYYGEATEIRKAKFMGIEDIWSKVNYWIDGLYIDSSWKIYTATDNFSSTGVGYTLQGSIPANINATFISEVVGTTELGFYPSKGGGTRTTSYCDVCYITNTRYVHEAGGTGIYYRSTTAGTTSTSTGYRIAFL